MPVEPDARSCQPEETTADATTKPRYRIAPMSGSSRLPRSRAQSRLKSRWKKATWTNAEVRSPQTAPCQIWTLLGARASESPVEKSPGRLKRAKTSAHSAITAYVTKGGVAWGAGTPGTGAASAAAGPVVSAPVASGSDIAGSYQGAVVASSDGAASMSEVTSVAVNPNP